MKIVSNTLFGIDVKQVVLDKTNNLHNTDDLRRYSISSISEPKTSYRTLEVNSKNCYLN